MMSINQGGLGLPHPMYSAIPTAVITTKRCIQFATEGVWVSDEFDPVQLPPAITHLFRNWKSSDLTSFKVFNKYLQDFTEICTPPPDSQQQTITNPTKHFIFKTSINRSRDLIKQHTSIYLRQLLERHILHEPQLQLQNRLDAILDKRVSMALFTMSRSQYKHRLPNNIFDVMVKRKLRLPLWPNTNLTHCSCSAKLDPFGDHCLGCTTNQKKTTSDDLRDSFAAIFKRILPIVHLIKHQNQVEIEPTKVIRDLPKQRPFDLAFRVEHSTSDNTWRCPLSRIGFDVTLIHSQTSSSTAMQDSDLLNNDEPSARLRDLGEKKKFERPRGGTNHITGKSITGDAAMGQLLDSNQGFIPIAIGPFGELGQIFQRFLYGTQPTTLPLISKDKPNAERALHLSISNKVPSNVLGRAKEIWTHKRNSGFFDGTYLASNPQIWAEQQIGLACVTHLGEHILRSQGQMTYSPHDDDDDVASLDGSIASQDTLPYNFDMCQLIDMRKKNWRDIFTTQLGTTRGTK